MAMTRWSAAGVTATLAAAVLIATVSPAGAADAPDAWSTENGGVGNAALNAGETALTPTAARTVRLRWNRPDNVTAAAAPAIVDGVGYEVLNPAAAATTARLVAFAPTTGRTLWTLALPTDGRYRRGLTVVGTVAVMSFDGQTRGAGVTAVGLTSRRVLWSTRQPAPLDPMTAGDVKVAGQVVADFSNVYMLGATNTINTFRLSDGVPQWKVASTRTLPAGIGLGNGVVYTGGAAGVIAYDTDTGEKSWTAPGIGAPVVAGGRVITAAGREVVAVAAAGCNGRAQCPALWRVTLPYPRMTATAIGGVDGVNGYLVYTDTARDNGGLVRFGAVSGKVLWRATIAAGAVRPVRGASTVWTVAGGTTLLGFSTSATGVRPLVSVVETTDRQGAGQSLALAQGTVFVRSVPRQLTAYGLPAA